MPGPRRSTKSGNRRHTSNWQQQQAQRHPGWTPEQIQQGRLGGGGDADQPDTLAESRMRDFALDQGWQAQQARAEESRQMALGALLHAQGAYP